MKYVLLFFCSLFSHQYLQAQCNGMSHLCGRTYDQVAYLTTHNAYNSDEDGFQLPNHNFNIAAQLQFGVRAFMIDIYDDSGSTVVYHGFTFLGTAPLSGFLDDIKTFMDANPNEVISIIFETYTTSAAVEAELQAAGLDTMLYAHTLGASWPTLQTMIDNNERLVIFSESNNGSPTQPWYHYVWDHAVETDFSNNAQSDFSCAFNRGNATNDLFILNHFITTSFGVGDATVAATINANPYLIDRALQCQSESGKFPNFVTVDFYELGETMQAVNILNDAVSSVFSSIEPTALTVFPNPAHETLTVVLEEVESEIRVYSLLGQNSTSRTQILSQNSNELILDISKLPSGMYVIQIGESITKFDKQ